MTGLLVWGVRAGFRDYVQRSGGTVSYGASVTWSEDGFVFPRVPVEPASPDAVLRFSGEVLFQAHHGVLSVMIADPWVEFRGVTGVISAADASGPGGRIEVATFVTEADGTLETRLTAQGAWLLGGVYPEGLPMDRAHLRQSPTPSA